MEQFRMIEGKDFADFISAFFNFTINILRYCFSAVREYLKIALILFILISAGGLFLWYRSTPYYEAEMICSAVDMNKKPYGEMVHNLDILAGSHSFEALAKQLNISSQDASSIISIEGRNMAGSLLYEDVTSSTTPIYFRLRASDNKIFPAVETALLEYLNHESPYLNSKAMFDSLEAQTQVENLRDNISTIDSVVAAYYSKLKKEGPATDTSINVLVEMLKFKNQLDDELTKRKRTVNNIRKRVDVVVGFVPTDHPNNSKNKILKLTFVVSLLCSVGVAVIKKALHDSPIRKPL